MKLAKYLLPTGQSGVGRIDNDDLLPLAGHLLLGAVGLVTLCIVGGRVAFELFQRVLS